MLNRSNIQLLRIPFSFFLMPVFWFAISECRQPDFLRAIMVFIILHFLLYPASNGYNSYMDRDTTSIGLLKAPPLPERSLYRLVNILDLAGLCACFLIGWRFFIGCLLFVIASRLYSYRAIRLKKYPVIGWIVAAFFQGLVVYSLTYSAVDMQHRAYYSIFPAAAAMLLIGSFYPLTQIYQHEADRADGVRTISMLLGYKGSFVFSGICFAAACAILGGYFISGLESERFLVFMLWMIPTLVYFFYWAAKVFRNTAFADFKHTMRMNLIGACCCNGAFLSLCLMSRP